MTQQGNPIILQMQEAVARSEGETLGIPEAQAHGLTVAWDALQEGIREAGAIQPGDIVVERTHLTTSTNEERRLWIVVRFLDHSSPEDTTIIDSYAQNYPMHPLGCDVIVGLYSDNSLWSRPHHRAQLRKWGSA